MKKERILWGAIFVLILIQGITIAYFFSGKQHVLTNTESLLASNETTSQNQEFEGASEQGQQEEEYVARFTDSGITRQELIDKLLHQYGDQVLDDMIDRYLVYSKAEQLGVRIPEEEVNKEVLSLRIGYGSEEEFFEEIEASMGISPDELKAEMEYYLLLEEMATMDIVISSEQISKFYQEHQELFEIPTQFYLYQIIVESLEAAQQAIVEIEQGSSFAAVAAEQSLDLTSSSNGGDLGLVSIHDYFIDANILHVAETLDLDTLSEPIPVTEGYAVIKVTERIEGEKLGLADVEGKIRRQLALQQIGGAAGFLERIREQANIQKFLR